MTAAGAADLTLERLFASPALSGPSPRALKLCPDGRLATLLRAREDDRQRYDLWSIDTATGETRMLVDSAAVGSGADLSEAEKMRRERLRLGGTRGIVGYEWAPDGRSLLVPIDGDLYLATVEGSVRRLTDGQPVLEPRLSGDGRHLSFARDGNLFVRDLSGETTRALTDDGGDAISWGTAEFIAQEELGRFAGHWWSPRGGRLAAQRTDESGVGIVQRAAIGAEGTRLVAQRYPAAGTPNARVGLWLFDVIEGTRIEVDLGLDPDTYLARVDWAPDGEALYVQRLTRDQTRLDMLAVDPATGASRLLFSETAATWINLQDGYRWLRDGSLLWTSERSGFPHLHRFADGRWTALTGGDWSVLGLAGVDEANGRAFVLANSDGVLESHLYAVDLRRPGPPRRLTDPGWSHAAMMDKAGTRALVTRSSPDQPPQVYLADAEGKRLLWIEENRLDDGHPYAPYLASHRTPIFGTIAAADGSTLHWTMIAPEPQPGRRHPVFMEHYGGPHVQTVTRAWQRPLVQYLVDRDWIWFMLDNRGSAHRGSAFEDQIHRAMGTVEVADQVAGARWLQAQPFVDADRIATFGWSYGGYLTLKLLEQAPGLFAAGIAGAPVTRWALYDTAYTERYLGRPPYDAADALPEAAAIRDPLLLIHGLADDNVVFDHSAALAARLQGAAVPFEMMAYPGQAHGFAGEGVQTHLWRTIEAFLDRHVPAR